MGGGYSTNRYDKTGALKYIGKSKNSEKAQEVKTDEVTDEDGDVRLRIRIYKWDHDGPFEQDDYEAVIFFYEKGSNIPKHAITFSHYGKIYHRNLQPWEDEDYSAFFPNSFHTPVLKSNTEFRGSLLSTAAYIGAAAGLIISTSKTIEPNRRMIKEGQLPEDHDLKQEIDEIKANRGDYWNELEEN